MGKKKKIEDVETVENTENESSVNAPTVEESAPLPEGRIGMDAVKEELKAKKKSKKELQEENQQLLDERNKQQNLQQNVEQITNIIVDVGFDKAISFGFGKYEIFAKKIQPDFSFNLSEGERVALKINITACLMQLPPEWFEKLSRYGCWIGLILIVGEIGFSRYMMMKKIEEMNRKLPTTEENTTSEIVTKLKNSNK